MKTNQKIHVLSQELIPVINDVDPEAQQIILQHTESCESCQKLYNQTVDFEENIPKHDYEEDVAVKPLKKLTQFNRGLKLFLIAVRVVILFYLISRLGWIEYKGL